jgi:hypothetical protein
MENSFLYSKSISFLTGQTRSTRPNPYHEPAPPALSLSLCTTASWASPAVVAHRSASTSLCGRAVVGARCAPPSRDARRSSLCANPRSTGRLPHLGIVGLPLPLDAKCLKPSTFRQAALCAHQAALPSPQQASVAAYPNALPRVCMRWRCPPLRPMPRAATSAQSSTSGKSATLHALHAQLALPLLTTLLAGTPALLCAHMRPPPSLCSCARLRSAAPSAGKRHTDAEPSHPWHREHGYKRATPTSCPHRTPPAIFLK